MSSASVPSMIPDVLSIMTQSKLVSSFRIWIPSLVVDALPTGASSPTSAMRLLMALLSSRRFEKW